MGVAGMIFVIWLYLLFLCLVNVDILVWGGGCLESERKALVMFKNGLDDPDNRLSSWQGQDCCRWIGVGCDNTTGSIIRIDLRNPLSMYGLGNLSGQIDHALLELKSLRHLDLSQNAFGNIPIPSFIGSLKELRYLNLSGAGFGGTIPWQLGNLSSLRYLDLSCDYSPLVSDSLQWVSGLHSLRHLVMDYVNLSMVERNWIEAINRLPFLTDLRLQASFLSSISPSPLVSVNLSSLAVLDLSWNTFNSSIPLWMINLTGLVSLDLSECDLHGPIPVGFSELPNLEDINLESNENLTANCSELLKRGWRKIRSMNLYINQIFGEIPATIGNMTTLVDLDLMHNNVMGRIPTTIGKLCELRSLNLSGNMLTGELPRFLETGYCGSQTPLPNLSSMELEYNNIEGNLPVWFDVLKNLVRLDLSYNSLQGEIPSSLGTLPFLSFLSLSNNRLNGTVPETFGQLSELVHLDLNSNQLTGVLRETHFASLRKLKMLDLYSNSLALTVNYSWVPPFQVDYLSLGSCNLGPMFPSWLQTQKLIMYLDISNAGISDVIPDWFWDISLNLSLLNLSFNQIHGQLPDPFMISSGADVDLRSNLLQGSIPLPSTGISLLDVSSNRFSGSIPPNISDRMPYLIILSASNNQLTGNIPPAIGAMQLLKVLDLSRNSLEGEIPSSILANCSNLAALDLSFNSLFGSIPWRSIGLLNLLKTLHLNSNHLSGDLPLSLKNCSVLETLDLGENRLSGTIPRSFGVSLTSLGILRLRSNNFEGEIPEELSYMGSLHVLDLAHNRLSGIIPQSFANFTAMTVTQKIDHYLFYGETRGVYYEESLFVSMKGSVSVYGKLLYLVTSIDLSSNDLSGEIPQVLTGLSGLLSLDLSRNRLTGKIPKNIANLKELLSLDVSENQLSGDIPWDISSMSFLSYFNLSNNNLSGKIPSGGQLETFDASSYMGNKELCGPPLVKICPDGKMNQQQALSPTGTVTGDDGSHDLWFYVSLGMGFGVGILGFFAALWIMPWRDAYFQFIDETIEKIMR